jgi:hypothetical protein
MMEIQEGNSVFEFQRIYFRSPSFGGTQDYETIDLEAGDREGIATEMDHYAVRIREGF